MGQFHEAPLATLCPRLRPVPAANWGSLGPDRYRHSGRSNSASASGEVAQGIGGLRAGHWHPVATGQNGRLKSGEPDDRLPGYGPIPGRIPGGFRETRPLAQEARQSVEFHGHHGIARDQDTVTVAKERDMTGRMARRGDALPTGQPRNPGIGPEYADDRPEVRSGKYCVTTALAHGAHDRQDEPGIKWSRVLSHGGEVSGGERQFTRMQVDRAVPRLGQLECGTGMIWVAVSEQDGGGTRIGTEQTLSCLLDQRAVFGPGGIDQRPRGICTHEVDVGLCSSERPETMHIRRDLPSDRARPRLMRRHTPIMALGASSCNAAPMVPQG